MAKLAKSNELIEIVLNREKIETTTEKYPRNEREKIDLLMKLC